MRKFYLILALLMSALTSSAQTSYEGKMEFDIPEVDITASLLPAKDHDSLADALGEIEGIESVYISKAMLSAISGRLNNMPSMPNVNAQALVNKLSCIQLIHAEKNNMRTKLKSEVKGIVKKDKYDLLMQVKEDSNKADIYQNVGPQQSAVVMLVEENDGVTAVVFSGKFTTEDVMKMVKK